MSAPAPGTDTRRGLTLESMEPRGDGDGRKPNFVYLLGKEHFRRESGEEGAGVVTLETAESCLEAWVELSGSRLGTRASSSTCECRDKMDRQHGVIIRVSAPEPHLGSAAC